MGLRPKPGIPLPPRLAPGPAPNHSLHSHPCPSGPVKEAAEGEEGGEGEADAGRPARVPAELRSSVSGRADWHLATPLPPPPYPGCSPGDRALLAAGASSRPSGSQEEGEETGRPVPGAGAFSRQQSDDITGIVLPFSPKFSWRQEEAR